MLIENPGRPEIQATFLISHLKLMQIGMKNSRLSGTKMLELATNITGNKYKRGQYIQAIADLAEFKKAYA
tara:strand:- start:1161 stop:1370 length:210 start_codon:yes stop_codon:yes gene_type:complete